MYWGAQLRIDLKTKISTLKLPHLGNVPQVVISCFGHIPSVGFEIDFRI